MNDEREDKIAEPHRLYAWLEGSPQDHDLSVPTFISHADAYANFSPGRSEMRK
jgi:hypothetical protein